MEEKAPLVGIQLLVIKEGKFLIGKDNSKGGVYGIPGGHWNNGETTEEGAIREAIEESGIKAKNLKFICNYEFYREDKERSYLTVSYIGEYESGEVMDNEEEAFINWQWILPEEALKLNLYPAAKVLIEKYLEISN